MGYKNYNNKFLAIIEAFKTWNHYRKGCKYKIFVSINYINFYQFIYIKNLNFCQVGWAQELPKSHFWMDYYQGKANGTANAFFREAKLKKTSYKLKTIEFFIN